MEDPAIVIEALKRGDLPYHRAKYLITNLIS